MVRTVVNIDQKGMLRITLVILLAAVLGLPGCVEESAGKNALHTARSYADRVGSRFIRSTEDPYRPPQLFSHSVPMHTALVPETSPPARDDRGHLWMAVADTSAIPSLHLLEYIPGQDRFIDRGDAISELRYQGLYRFGENQGGLATRLIQADDGYLYFVTNALPAANSRHSQAHLWRIHPQGEHWEHLRAIPNQLRVLSGVGRYVYALANRPAELHQYDTASGLFAMIALDAAHEIIQPMIADYRGHIFLFRRNLTDGEPSLLELGDVLQPLAEHPLLRYELFSFHQGMPPAPAVYMADSTIIFGAPDGFLYRISPQPGHQTLLREVGWFHPDGVVQPRSLFTLDGERYLVGVTRREAGLAGRFNWVVHDLVSRTAAAYPFQLSSDSEQMLDAYGAVTRDDRGHFYLAGSYRYLDRYQVTDEAVKHLQAAGMRRRSVLKLAALIQQPPQDGHRFLQTLRKYLGRADADQYQSQLLAFTKDKQIYPTLIRVQPGSEKAYENEVLVTPGR